MLKSLNLMTNPLQIPDCTHEYGHEWVSVVRPSGNQSGWHEEKCKHCGFVIGYDTSD